MLERTSRLRGQPPYLWMAALQKTVMEVLQVTCGSKPQVLL
ncbi:Uncharacterised protein [Vibrio cholerae]|nr:Uncharacterised protein [Vibrio cholerae]